MSAQPEEPASMSTHGQDEKEKKEKGADLDDVKIGLDDGGDKKMLGPLAALRELKSKGNDSSGITAALDTLSAKARACGWGGRMG